MVQEQRYQVEDGGLAYAHWLYSVPGVGSRTIKHLLAQAKTAEALYQLSEKSWRGC